MRVVFVNRIAWPDEGATALYLSDVAESLATAGHDVHVVCGDAPYRAVARASRARAPRVHRGVRYHRVPGARGRGVLGRAASAAWFGARAGWRLLRVPRADVVVGLTDPPFVDAVSGAVARLRDGKAVSWMMDVYPDVAVAAGVLSKRSVGARVLGLVASWSLRRADAVVVLSPAMRRPILARGVARGRVHVVENWAPECVERAATGTLRARARRAFTLLYSGTYGVAHDLAPLFARLRRLPERSVRLVIQAAGARIADLRREAAGLPVEVEWREPVALEGLAASLSEADAHVVAVREGFERLVAPSKAYAPLALGAPLVLVGTASRCLDRRARTAPPAAAPACPPALADAIEHRAARPRTEGLAEWRSLLERLAAGRRRGRR